MAEVHNGRDYKHLQPGNIPVYGTSGYMLSVDDALSWNEDAVGIGRKGTIDKPYILRAPFWTVDTLFFVTPRPSTPLEFLFTVFESVNWKSKDESTGVPSLTKQAIVNTAVKVPNTYEQCRIGGFFSVFDNLIAAAERQETLLRQKKQAYLQLMFPQEGETEPRLRFAGFSGEWQRRKLRELVSEGSIALKRGEVIPRQTGKYPVYSSSASEDGLFCTSDSFMFDQELVTWSIDGGGKPFYRQHHRFSVTNVCGYALILNPQTLTYRFLGLAMGRAWARAHFDYSSKAHPSVIEKIYILSIPSLPEQRCIGAFFSTLDNLIAVAEKRTKSLHTLKSSYLQRMFV